MHPCKTNRSAFLKTICKAFHLSAASSKSGIPFNELFGLKQKQAADRRRFITSMVKGGIVIGAGGVLHSCKKVADIIPAPQTSQPAIAIIGAGMAGLNCAYKLKKSGYIATIYEGSSRISGRILTQNNLLAPGLFTELGGEFIDSDHDDMLSLAGEFGLNLLDTRNASETSYARDSFYVNGRFYTEDEVITAFQPYANAISSDINSLPDDISYDDHDDVSVQFDNMSIRQYLDGIGMSGFLRAGIEAAYLTEYGLETDLQSSINFLFMFTPDTSGGFDIFGSSDERYKIDGGNQMLTNAIYQQVREQVLLQQNLVHIKENSKGYTLTFADSNGSAKDVYADMVVIAIPFTLLREVSIEVQMPDWKMNAINNLGYGTNAKLLLGFTSRIWRQYQHSGYTFTDKVLQNGWDNSWRIPGSGGGYTVYQGGNNGTALGSGTPESQAIQFVQQMEQMWPGCSAAYNGNVSRAHWPSNPFTKASYACYKVGQYTTIRGAEIKNIGNLYFAGEHCSANFQGYMNGAAETGRQAAASVILAI